MVPPRTLPRLGRMARAGAAAAAAAAIVLGTATVAAADTAPSPAPSPIERTDCPVDVPDLYADRVECGVLIVPESRADGADPAKTLRLPYAIISSSSNDPAPDPLVFPTSGGPGGGSLDRLDYFLEWGAWATANRDVILLEQRGDLLADPTLDCPELSAAAFIVDGEYLGGDAAEKQSIAGITACRDRLTEAGVDLTAYTSRASVADLVDLRTALEYDQWNLYGVSYGGRLALTVMRDAPAGLRSVILDSPLPPQIDLSAQRPTSFAGAVDQLVAACEAESPCADAYPDLGTTITDVLDAAAESPLEITVDSPVDGSAVRIRLDDTALASGLFQALYDAGAIRILPFLIDQIARGNADAATPLAQQQISGEGGISEGLQLSVDCAEELPFSDPEAVAEAYDAYAVSSHLDGTFPFLECEAWGVPALGDRETAVVESDIPTLITSGAFDPITPLPFAEAAAEGLSAAQVVSFDRMSHGAVWENWVDDCAAGVAERFLDDPTAEVSARCIDHQPAVGFLTTADIDPTSAVYRLNRDLIDQREPVQIGIAVSTVLLMIATLVYGAVVAARRHVHLRGDIPAGTVLAAATTSALNLAYAAGLAIVMVTSDPLTLGFGLPPAVWPMLLLPFAALAIAILLVVLLVRAWMRDDGTLFHRIALSVSAAASIGFTLWLLGRGLLML